MSRSPRLKSTSDTKTNEQLSATASNPNELAAPVASKWDVKEADATTADKVESCTDSVFQKISALRRTGIEIKYGSTVSNDSGSSSNRETTRGSRESTSSSTSSSRDRQKEKIDPYGKWESVPASESTATSSTNTKSRDLSKFTKLCLEISAKESKYESHQADSETRLRRSDNEGDDDEEEDRIHHPFISKPAPVMPPIFGGGGGGGRRFPMVEYSFLKKNFLSYILVILE